MARDGGRCGVVAASSTRGVIPARRRLVSSAPLASVVLSGFVTDRHIAHLPLNLAVGRPIVRIGIVRGRGGRSWEISTSVVRGDRFVGTRQRAPGVVGRDRFGTRQYTSGVVRRNRLVARQGSTSVVRRNGALTGQGSAGMVWRDRSLTWELSSPVVWGHRSLPWELTTSVVRRNWPLAREGTSTLVRGDRPLSRELPPSMVWRDGPLGEGTRGRIWRHPSNSRLVLILGLPITFTSLAKFSLLDPFTFVTFPLATGGLLLIAFAMFVLLTLPIGSCCVNITTNSNKMTTNHSRSRSRSEPRQDCWNS